MPKTFYAEKSPPLQLVHFMERLDEVLESGLATARTPVIALVVEPGLTAADAVEWSEVPIIEVRVDDEDREVLLQRDDSDDAVAITLDELVACLKTLVPGWLECAVFVAHDEEMEDDWMRTCHTPVVTVAANEGQRALGVIPWFEGWQQVLG